jgi:hypothetical protein
MSGHVSPESEAFLPLANTISGIAERVAKEKSAKRLDETPDRDENEQSPTWTTASDPDADRPPKEKAVT